jgi:polyhydroxyalkanoate synthesis regulator phasin
MKATWRTTVDSKLDDLKRTVDGLREQISDLTDDVRRLKRRVSDLEDPHFSRDE